MDTFQKKGQVTVKDVIVALRQLGGRSEFMDIYKTLKNNRLGDFSYYRHEESFRECTRQCIYKHCKGNAKYKGKEVKFKKDGKFYNLLESDINTPSDSLEKTQIIKQKTPIATDIELPTSPEKVEQHLYRKLRDTALARIVKEDNHYECEICNDTIKLKDGRLYAEAHHLKPLGRPHDGPDVRENIICVCPNDHVRLDYGAIALDIRELSGVGKEYVDYHNEKIYKNE